MSTGCSTDPLVTFSTVTVRGPASRSSAFSWSLFGISVSVMSMSDLLGGVDQFRGITRPSDGAIPAGALREVGVSRLCYLKALTTNRDARIEWALVIVDLTLLLAASGGDLPFDDATPASA
jgi:hypothetical protein